ncbi:hypothetical protein Tco_1273522 [Tanacetum coccineum]
MESNASELASNVNDESAIPIEKPTNVENYFVLNIRSDEIIGSGASCINHTASLNFTINEVVVGSNVTT